MSNYKELQKSLLEEGTLVTEKLQKITLDLITLVEKEKITSFSFVSQGHNGYDNDKHIRINIMEHRSGDSIPIGLFEHFKEVPKSNKLEKELFDTLSPLNDYVFFINSHLAKDIPVLEVNTYYSINALLGLGGFEREPVKNLLPPFMDSIIPKKNQAKKIRVK